MSDFVWHEDPGHAWLRVPKALVKALNIEHEISSYSYEDDDNFYLEEDCDAAVFANAYKKMNGTVSPLSEAEVVFTDDDSFVRYLNRAGTHAQ